MSACQFPEKFHIIVTAVTSQIGLAICESLSTKDAKNFHVTGIHFGGDDDKTMSKKKMLENLNVKVLAREEFEHQKIGSCLVDTKLSAMIIVPTTFEDNARHMKCWIDNAESLKMKHIITHGAGTKNPNKWFKEFLQVEEYLKSKKGLKWTILRPSFLMQNLLLYADDVKSRRVLPVATDKKFAMIDVNDLAKAVKSILWTMENHVGKIYELTGPLPANVYEMADVMTKTFNEKIHGEKVSMDQAKSLLTSRQLKPSKVDAFARFYETAEQGDLDYITQDYRQITKEDPTSLSSFLKKNSKCFITEE